MVSEALTISNVANVATAIGVGVAAYHLRVTQKQGVTTFEDSLTSQYRDVLRSIPLEALLGKPVEGKKYEESLPYFYRYFDLCNEQMFLYENGRISDETWRFWEEGIRTNMAREAFENAWSEIAHFATDDFENLRIAVEPKPYRPTSATDA